MVPFESLSAVSYLPSIVTMALSCISSEIKPNIGRKWWFFHTLLHSAPLLGGPRWNIAIPFGAEKLEWWGYPIVKIIIIISGFGIYGAAVVPNSGVGNTWQRLTLVLDEFLSNGFTPSRLHIVISFFTHADHDFLGLPRSLVPGSPNRVMELMHEVARCTCPYHLRRRVRRRY